jgi:hypothetical protein
VRSCTVVATMFLCVKMVATKIAPQRGTAAGTEAAGKSGGLSGFCEQRRLREAKRRSALFVRVIVDKRYTDLSCS